MSDGDPAAAGTPHRITNPAGLAPPTGFAHALEAAPGRLVFLGGQTAHRADGTLPDGGIVPQFDQAAANVAAALAAAGGRPEHIAWMQVFTSRGDEYRANLRPIGEAYRRRLGRHYPAMAWFEVAGLFDPAAVVEICCIAVVPPAEDPPAAHG